MPVASTISFYLSLACLLTAAWPGALPDQRWILVPLIGALWLGMLADMHHWRRLAWWLLLPTTLAAFTMLSSYAIAESWIATATWQAWLDRLPGDWPLYHVRPPVLSLSVLVGLALNPLMLMRLGLGSPVLLLLMSLGLGTLTYHTYAPPPLHASTLIGTPTAILLSLWLLWLHQFLTLLPVLKHYWRRILPPLSVSGGIMLITLLGWQNQRESDNARLYRQIVDDGDRIATLLAYETTAHLEAMRRFASFWSMLGRTPTRADWERQAKRYYDDFGYFRSILFIDTEGVVLRVFPLRDNQALQGISLYSAGSAIKHALNRPLVYGIEGQGGIVDLRGGRGITSFLPVRNVVDGTLLGAVGTVVSLSNLIQSLLTQMDSDGRAIMLTGENQLYFRDGPLGDLADWRYEQPVALGADRLTLSVKPGRALLLKLRERLPEVTLFSGVLLAYLLYMVLYIYRRLKHQHRLASAANDSLREEIQERERLQREIEWLAAHDELTQLPNRRHLLQWMDSSKREAPMALLICDLDHFKQINDHFGHLTGDLYLQALASRCRTPVEAAGGLFARYGGEEFVACIPRCDRSDALKIADTLRQAASKGDLLHADGRPVTLSVGITIAEHDEQRRDHLFQTADEALYRAKQAGRDRVEVATMPA